jgi:hypothetical protein
MKEGYIAISRSFCGCIPAAPLPLGRVATTAGRLCEVHDARLLRHPKIMPRIIRIPTKSACQLLRFPPLLFPTRS